MAPWGHQWVTERVQGPLPTTGGHQGEEAGEGWTEEIIWSVSTFEPPRGKSNNVVFDQVRHKPACTSTEAD